MKARFPNKLATLLLKVILSILCVFTTTYSYSFSSPELPVLSDISGTIWIETDGNSIDNGEPGPSNVVVQLFDFAEDTLITESLSVDGTYTFDNVPAGKYYLRIPNNQLQLANLSSCPGFNDADNMVDNDDNGSDTDPFDIVTTPFDLTNEDPNNDVPINYIDFCFFSDCTQPNIFGLSSCDDIGDSFFCEVGQLDNICAIMPFVSSPGDQPDPLCDGNSMAENITWMGFVAGAGSYNIEVTPFNCPFGGLGQPGIQVGLYTDCSFDEVVFCSDCTEDPINISSSFLTPGQVYYLYINGCGGNVCNYQIDVSGTPTTPTLEPDDVCILSGGSFQCEEIAYCANSDILFDARGVDIDGDFLWTIATLSGGPYVGDSLPETNQNQLVLNIADEGKYQVCIQKITGPCNLSWDGPKCQTFTIDFGIVAPADEDFGETSVCIGDLEEFNINVFANDDPNGDGDFGWNVQNSTFDIGQNMGSVSIEGCSYDQEFVLSYFEPSEINDVLISVCVEDLPITIDGITFSSFSFNGMQTITLDSFVLNQFVDENGCDSIVNLTIEKLEIVQGALLEPVCTMDGAFFEFSYIDLISTDIEFIEFVWKDPAGNILDSGDDPTTVLAPFESGNGLYTLDITINKNGEVCEYFYSAFFDVEIYLPPTPTVSGPSIVCEDEDNAVYSATGNGEESTFIWSFPNTVSAVVSGAMNEILTVDWTGSPGGNIVVLGQNTCGQSNQTTFEVEVIPKVTPEFTIDTSVCIDNIAIIDYFGTGINVSEYSWNFDGGSVVSGTGMGPYEVVWDTPGDKVVSLVTTDLNGCLSNETQKTIIAKAPLTPTAVNCIPAVGEVTFTWEIPIGVAGFEVNVLSGQTGGVFAATSFTIDGLGEGEEVTIELLTMPEDPICGEFVSTIASCIAQDCQAPVIELVADEDAVCEDGDNITITANITSGEMGTGTFEGPGIVDENAGIFDPSQANIGGNTILYTFISNVANCVGTKTINIEVFEIPTASFVQNADTICITDMLNLDYTGTVNASTFNWDFEDGVGSGLLTNQNVLFNSPGLKMISLQVVKDGCVSEVTSSSVFVEPELADVVVQCDTAGTDFITFSWNQIDGAPLFEIKVDNNAPFFTPNTTYTVENLDELQEVNIEVTSLSTTTCPGSTGTSSCTTQMTVSSLDAELDQIQLYPNPVSDVVYIDGIEEGGWSYQLLTISGQSIKQGNLQSNRIEVQSLPSGVYFVRIKSDKNSTFKDFRIVKE